MVYIVIGALGFLILHLFDIITLKRIPWVKSITWISGCGLLLYSIIWLSIESDRLLLPAWLTGIGWGLLVISQFLLMYSLLVNLPLRMTYIATGVGDRLIKTGLYSLVRQSRVSLVCFINAFSGFSNRV